jgi:hypothetical protein
MTSRRSAYQMNNERERGTKMQTPAAPAITVEAKTGPSRLSPQACAQQIAAYRAAIAPLTPSADIGCLHDDPAYAALLAAAFDEWQA